jgi:hypothetical protein
MPRKGTVGFLTGEWSWGTEPLQPNGCAWYRCALPINELTRYQWVCGLGFPGFTHEKGFGIIQHDKKIIQGWDLIVFKLLMQRSVLEFMPRARELGQKIVVDIDDFFDGLHPTNRAFAGTDPSLNEDNNRDIYAQIIMQADAIITSTPFLFDYYSKKRNNVFLVRNGIDEQRWPRKKPQSNNRATIGWVGATPWRSNDLEQLTPWFSKYMESRKIRFHHSGHTVDAPLANKLLGIPDDRSSTSPLVPILQYPQLFKFIDIGIVPLNDIPFNHAKSFIKGLEYAAAGIPFVSSYSPEYQYLADHGIGRIAKNADDWMYHLDELRIESIRRDEIEHNFEHLKNFTIEKRGKDWNSTLKLILDTV